MSEKAKFGDGYVTEVDDEWEDKYDVSVKIISIEGKCDQGHEVGQEWIVGDQTVEGIGLGAWGHIHDRLSVLKLGGTFPWERRRPTPDKHVVRVACPDIRNPVVFEVRRVQK